MIGIMGKNGAGKTFLANQLYALGFNRNIGYTTRPMRNNEVNGLDYHFISKQDFEEYIAQRRFIDYKIRNGHYYGMMTENFDNNTILLAGDYDKIQKATGYDIVRIYIDADLERRYSRVLTRNDSPQEVFDRFHSENFSYLFDFNAVFIDNNFDNSSSLDRILSLGILDQAGLRRLELPNRLFLQQRLDDINFSELFCRNNSLLSVLEYEEFLLRELFIQNKDIYSTDIQNMYYSKMLQFMRDNNIVYNSSDQGLVVCMNNNNYNFDYKVKKKVL